MSLPSLGYVVSILWLQTKWTKGKSIGCTANMSISHLRFPVDMVKQLKVDKEKEKA